MTQNDFALLYYMRPYSTEAAHSSANIRTNLKATDFFGT